MTARKVIFAVLCALLAVVIIMSGILLGRVGELAQTLFAPQSSTPETTVPTTTAPPPATAPTQPATVPTEPPETTVPVDTGHTHQYELTETVGATCENFGYSIYTCAGCGKQNIPYEEQADPLGHTFGDGETVAPTCTEYGCIRYTCTRCGMTEDKNKTGAAGHSFQLTETVVGTCVTDGYSLYTCTVCGAEEKRDETVGTGHDYQNVESVAPGCNEEGYARYRCSICGDEYVYTAPADGHFFGDWATRSAGPWERVCLFCGEMQSTENLMITKTQVSVSGVEGESLQVYVICVGSIYERELFRFTVYDLLDNDTLGFSYDGTRGLVVGYVSASGETVEAVLYFDTTAPYIAQ